MNKQNLDLNLLIVFEAIYETRNISKAAEMLDLSQPAISNALKRLREQLDDQLFIRAAKGVKPTPRAEKMIDSVTSALNLIKRDVEQNSLFDPATSSRQFRITIADPLEDIIFQKFASIMQHSDITLEQTNPQTGEMEDLLFSDKVQLVVFMKPENYPELRTKALCDFDLVMIMRKNHPRYKPLFSVEDFLSENHVVINIDKRRLANSAKIDFFRRLDHQAKLRVNSVVSIARMVAVSDYIGFVPRRFVKINAARFGLDIIEADFKMNNQQFYMSWHKRYDDDAGHKWLREQIYDVFRD